MTDRLGIEGKISSVYDPAENVWWREKSPEPWRTAIGGRPVFKNSKDMNVNCTALNLKKDGEKF